MPTTLQNLIKVYKKSHDEKLLRRKLPEKKEAIPKR